MTSSRLIKKEIKNLTLEQLKKKKEAILNFLMSFPDDKRGPQGWHTLDVVNALIESKETKDSLKEDVLKTMFFE